MACIFMRFLLLLVQGQIVTNASRYCKEAVESVERVSYCPRTKKEWDTAATRKDCSRLAGRQACTDANNFRYHCVINGYQNETLEVCAPRKIIFGYCAQFFVEGGIIQPNLIRPCGIKTNRRCDELYYSTGIYKYPGCYELRNPQPIPPTTTTTTTTKTIGTKKRWNCPKGSYGDNCGRRCPYPNYGRYCSLICDCTEQNCHHANGCPRLGKSCPAGFIGIYCEIRCRFPSYGSGCQQICHCPELYCNSITGCSDKAKKMEVQDTLITPCYASVQTVRIVSMCPADMSSYEEAVNKKNCLALAAYGQDCQNLQYHCVLSEDLKYAIEVCAPSSYIVGHACAMFVTPQRRIMQIDDFNCKTCPFSYNSTEAFKYSDCYSNITRLHITKTPLRLPSHSSPNALRSVRSGSTNWLGSSHAASSTPFFKAKVTTLGTMPSESKSITSKVNIESSTTKSFLHQSLSSTHTLNAVTTLGTMPSESKSITSKVNIESSTTESFLHQSLSSTQTLNTGTDLLILRRLIRIQVFKDFGTIHTFGVKI